MEDDDVKAVASVFGPQVLKSKIFTRNTYSGETNNKFILSVDDAAARLHLVGNPARPTELKETLNNATDWDGFAAALEAAVAANPQFANARYFLAAVYAKEKDMKDALAQMQAIADMSADNAKSVAPQITALTAGTNPFPANLLSASSTPVKQ